MKLKALSDYSNDRLDRPVGIVTVKAGEVFEVADELGAWLMQDAPQAFALVPANAPTASKLAQPVAEKKADAPRKAVPKGFPAPPADTAINAPVEDK